MSKEITPIQLGTEIKQLIEQSRQNVAVTVNAELTMLYWNVGKRINEDILKNNRAEYGKEIVNALSSQLTAEYGKGWGEKQLRHCIRFAETFPDFQIVYALRIQLTWTHIRRIMFIEDDLKRWFYLEMCKMERWSTRTLDERINSMLYERTAISKKPDETIKHDLALLNDDNKLSTDLVFRDPYFLDFLGLKDAYSEKDLETAILAELQRFILEFGNDFAFLARQKRIVIDDDDYYIDLLFYHRKLKRLIVIELKLDKFKPGYKSQLELYLRWLDKYEKQEGENPPLGILLCAEKSDEVIQLLELDKSGIHVASYLTELPPIEWLKAKLHKSIEDARNRLSNN
jgi:predicted nuclease of restriction endonuclease-like (RecB) superfamily